MAREQNSIKYRNEDPERAGVKQAAFPQTSQAPKSHFKEIAHGAPAVRGTCPEPGRARAEREVLTRKNKRATAQKSPIQGDTTNHGQEITADDKNHRMRTPCSWLGCRQYKSWLVAGWWEKKFSRKLRVFSGIVRMVQQTKVSLCDDAQGSARRPYEISESPKLRERKINTTQNNQIERNQLFQRLNQSSRSIIEDQSKRNLRYEESDEEVDLPSGPCSIHQGTNKTKRTRSDTERRTFSPNQMILEVS